jgi:hypothetical protein
MQSVIYPLSNYTLVTINHNVTGVILEYLNYGSLRSLLQTNVRMRKKVEMNSNYWAMRSHLIMKSIGGTYKVYDTIYLLGLPQ